MKGFLVSAEENHEGRFKKFVLPDSEMIKSSLDGKREVELGSAVARREPKHSSKLRQVHLKSEGRADIQGFPSAVSRLEARRRPQRVRKVCQKGGEGKK